MHTQIARIQAWIAEIAAHGMPSPAPRAAGKRARKLKPLWEE